MLIIVMYFTLQHGTVLLTLIPKIFFYIQESQFSELFVNLLLLRFLLKLQFLEGDYLRS